MPRHARALTDGEVELARSVFGDAIDYARVRVCRSKWTFFQPRRVVMAPMGALHFHPHGDLYCDDFGAASQSLKGLFIHEMVHVWQALYPIFPEGERALVQGGAFLRRHLEAARQG